MSVQSPKLISLVDVDRQAGELEAVRRMLDASRGTFSLSVAICDSPALRDYLIEKLRANYPGIEVVSIPPKTTDVYGLVRQAVRNADRSALFLINLEKSIRSTDENQTALRSLNASRELWADAFPCPVVFWLPEYAATLLSESARDFWAWRSHQFEFVSEPLTAAYATSSSLAGGYIVVGNLDADRKRFRIAELEQRIAEAGDPPSPAMAVHVSTWLNEMGFLFYSLGDLDKAERMYRKALKIDERLGRQEGVAAAHGNLGGISITREDLDEAERMLRKALEIDERLGRQEDVAGAYINLGLIFIKRGNLDEAEQMLRKALEINECLGRQEGLANTYNNLALLSMRRGDLDEAERMLRKALEIDQRLGRQEGMANAYGNLGLLSMRRGDLDEAERMFRKALEIDQRLGRQGGMANAYENLGILSMKRGDLDEAERMLRKAQEIDQRLGRQKGMANAYGNLSLLSMRPHSGDG